MRALNKVVRLSDHMVAIGSGNNFGRILKIVPPEKYTMIHGNSLTVGVGGFIQGVGVNTMGMSTRHGFAGDHVLRYKMVLADGSIALVTKVNTTIIERYGKK